MCLCVCHRQPGRMERSFGLVLVHSARRNYYFIIIIYTFQIFQASNFPQLFLHIIYVAIWFSTFYVYQTISILLFYCKDIFRYLLLNCLSVLLRIKGCSCNRNFCVWQHPTVNYGQRLPCLGVGY